MNTLFVVGVKDIVSTRLCVSMGRVLNWEAISLWEGRFDKNW